MTIVVACGGLLPSPGATASPPAPPSTLAEVPATCEPPAPSEPPLAPGIAQCTRENCAFAGWFANDADVEGDPAAGALKLLEMNGRGDEAPEAAAAVPFGFLPRLAPVAAPLGRPRPAGVGVAGRVWSKLALDRTEVNVAGVDDCVGIP